MMTSNRTDQMHFYAYLDGKHAGLDMNEYLEQKKLTKFKVNVDFCRANIFDIKLGTGKAFREGLIDGITGTKHEQTIREKLSEKRVSG